MSNMSLCVLFSLLIVGISSFAFHNKVTSSDEQSSYTNLVASVFILMRCLPTDSHLTIVLGGDYNEFVVQSHINMIPVVLIDERNPRVDVLQKFTLTRYSYPMFTNYNFNHFLRKAHRFVLVTSSQPLLRALLQKAKDSPWANPGAFYFLVDKQTETRGCINARSYLWTAWEYDLLSVIFICVDPNDGVVLYTFNPYSNSTPDNWYEVGHITGRAGHPWIILKRKFIHDSNTCIDLNFDKTTTLNRYPIRLNAVEMEPFIKINLSLSKQERFRGESSEIIRMVLNKLNASCEITIHHTDVYSLGGTGPNGSYGLIAPVSNDRIDIGMNTRPLLTSWKIRYLYPHMRSGHCVIAQPKKQISEFIKVVTFLSPEVIMGIIVICLLTYVMFVKSVGYIKAGLEIIRLVVCIGFLHLPKMDSIRIVICMALILFLNINALFQSRLSALLTVPTYYRDIDSIQSLKDAGYTLYGPKFYEDKIGDPILQSRYKVITHKDCMEHVENSSTAVCIGDCYHLFYRIKNKNLIKSKMLYPTLRSYVTRENWPLYNRVNNIIQRMMQAGLITKARDEILWKIKREKERRIALTKKSFNIMSLKQLTFSFYILGFGYACAIIIFMLEMAIGGSVPICQKWKAIRKGKKKNRKKKKESGKNNKLFISALKTNLQFKRLYKQQIFSVKKQCISKSCISIENENQK